MNPFDEIAVEEAVRMKEAGLAQEIVAVSLGGTSSQETLRTALALGADRAILVQTESDVQPYGVASVLNVICQREGPDVVLMGKQAIDDDSSQVPQMLAARNGWSQATFASKIVIADQKAQVTREVDGGLRTIEVTLPTVISVDLRLNEPRYASLPNIMKAKKKPLDVVPVTDLGADLEPRCDTLKVCEPPERQAGVKVSSVTELVDKLKNEAKVL